MTVRPPSEAGGDKLAEGVGTMAHRMLFVGVDLAEGLASAQRLEHRIIAETLGPARRPDDDAVHPAFEAFDMAIGPGKRQCADEMGVVARFRPGALHRFMAKPQDRKS